MKKNLFGWLAMATMLVGTGCSSDEVVNDYSPENAIQFGTYVGRDAQGRASVIDDTNLGTLGFGVYALFVVTVSTVLWDRVEFSSLLVRLKTIVFKK